LDEYAFHVDTTKRLRKRLDYYFSVKPDSDLSSKVNPFCYMHYMCNGTFYALMQQNPKLNTAVNPAYVSAEKMHFIEQSYVNDTLVSVPPQTMYHNAENPFNHVFTLLTWGRLTEYNFKGLEWNSKLVVPHYCLLRSMSDLRRAFTQQGHTVLPRSVQLFGTWYELSHWISETQVYHAPTNELVYGPPRPIRWQCNDPLHQIETKLWLIMCDFGGKLECGLDISDWVDDLFNAEKKVTRRPDEITRGLSDFVANAEATHDRDDDAMILC